MKPNATYDRKRDELLATVGPEWTPRRGLVNPGGTTAAYDDLLFAGVLEERVERTGKYQTRTVMVRRKP